MNTRHRIPSVFNLSMVDVLCCALGCVILLWLMNFRDAKKRSVQAGETRQELLKTKSLLDTKTKEFEETLARLRQKDLDYNDVKSDLTSLQKLNRKLSGDLKNRALELDKTSKQWQLARLTISELTAKLASLDGKLSTTSKDLSSKVDKLVAAQRLVDLLTEKLSKSSSAIEELSGKLTKSEKDLLNLTAKLLASNKKEDDLTGQLSESIQEQKVLGDKLVLSEKLAKKLELALADLRLDAKLLNEKLALAQKSGKTLDSKLTEKQTDIDLLSRQLEMLLKDKKTIQESLTKKNLDLAEANARILNLQTERTKLIQQQNLIRSAVENRFAGINLTGKKVIFLVDHSGSMSMQDSQKEAPDKWPTVCETITKLLKSLPDLTHYQVILFSENIIYPLGNQGNWLVYNPEESPATTSRKLQLLQPKGGTKMRSAVAEAFKFRVSGLDTIYLISDGLPNDDDNLPEEINKLQGIQRTAYLSKQVRDIIRLQWNRPDNEGQRVRINAIGFFFESPEVGAFLWALARENDGNFVGMSRP